MLLIATKGTTWFTQNEIIEALNCFLLYGGLELNLAQGLYLVIGAGAY